MSAAPYTVKREIASKSGTSKFDRELLAMFNSGFYFIFRSASFLHALLSMGMKTNCHSLGSLYGPGFR